MVSHLLIEWLHIRPLWYAMFTIRERAEIVDSADYTSGDDA